MLLLMLMLFCCSYFVVVDIVDVEMYNVCDGLVGDVFGYVDVAFRLKLFMLVLMVLLMILLVYLM